MATPEDMMFENQQFKLKARMTVTITFLVVSGVVGSTYLFLNRPIHPEPPVQEAKPLISSEDCIKMCPETGVASYDLKGCTCNPPKKPGLLQVDKMDCNCACVPMTWRQQQSSENKEVPQQR